MEYLLSFPRALKVHRERAQFSLGSEPRVRHVRNETLLSSEDFVESIRMTRTIDDERQAGIPAVHLQRVVFVSPLQNGDVVLELSDSARYHAAQAPILCIVRNVRALYL